MLCDGLEENRDTGGQRSHTWCRKPVRKCLLEPPNFSKGEAYPGDLGQGGGNQSRARKGREASPRREGSWGDQVSVRTQAGLGTFKKYLGNSQLRLNGLQEATLRTSPYS